MALSPPLELLVLVPFVGGCSSPGPLEPEELEAPDDPEVPDELPVDVPLHATSTSATKVSETYRMG